MSRKYHRKWGTVLGEGIFNPRLLAGGYIILGRRKGDINVQMDERLILYRF